MDNTDHVTSGINVVALSDAERDDAERLVTISIVVALCTFVIMLGSLSGNLLVIFAIRKDASLHNSANFIICSLAVTDLLVAFLVMPFNAVYQISGSWIFGDVFCQIWSATDIACCTASILHLCAIALERHQSVTNAVRYFSTSQKHGAAPKIFIVWILAVCISIPPVLGWRTNVDSLTVNQTETSVKHCQVGHQPSYTVFATLGSFYVPLVMLLIMYGRIYRSIHTFVQRSSSRSILSSLHSEDRTSIGTRRSSLFSDRKKSNSRGSLRSRLNFLVNDNSPLQQQNVDRTANSRQAKNGVALEKHVAPDKIDQHQHRKECGIDESKKEKFSKLLRNRTDSTNGCSKSLDLNQCSEKNVNRTALSGGKGEPHDIENQNRNCVSESQHVQDNEKVTSLKDYKMKVHSYTSASNRDAKLRYKRSTNFRRQNAIEEDFEETVSKEQRMPTPVQTTATKIDKAVFMQRILTPLNKTVPKRRCSDSDLQQLSESNNSNENTTPPRPRTHTTGARVHFTKDTKSNCGRANDGVESVRYFPAVVKEAEKLYSARKCRRASSKDLERRETQTTIYSQLATSEQACCFPLCRKNNDSVGLLALQDNSRNPYTRYSFSLRSKMKALRAREVRAIKTLGTIVSAFVVCWLPFFIVTIAKPFCSCYISQTVEGIVLWLGYCNSMVNPIIYAACNRDFQNAFKKLLSPAARICPSGKCIQVCGNEFYI